MCESHCAQHSHNGYILLTSDWTEIGRPFSSMPFAIYMDTHSSLQPYFGKFFIWISFVFVLRRDSVIFQKVKLLQYFLSTPSPLSLRHPFPKSDRIINNLGKLLFLASLSKITSCDYDVNVDWDLEIVCECASLYSLAPYSTSVYVFMQAPYSV